MQLEEMGLELGLVPEPVLSIIPLPLRFPLPILILRLLRQSHLTIVGQTQLLLQLQLGNTFILQTRIKN